MPKADLTELICIIDRSGSMDGIRDDAIGGFNAFLEEQKKVPGDATLTLMLFDDEFLVVHSGTDIQQVPPLDDTTYVPRGSTALYDAIGRTINETEARLGQMPDADRPGKALVLILTDGKENASKEFDKGRIQKVLKDHEAKGWEFIYLKAGPDAFDEASGIGISRQHYATVGPTGKGLRSGYAGSNAMATGYRSGKDIGCMSLQESVGQSQMLGDKAFGVDPAEFIVHPTPPDEEDASDDSSA